MSSLPPKLTLKLVEFLHFDNDFSCDDIWTLRMELFRKIIVTIVQEEINTYRNSDMGGAGGRERVGDKHSLNLSN